ncbi:asparagine synthase (glutamine-hydrolyzing) [Larkinella insperata]|uniref:asparagine synthase (glutamine-hydrolyzing) n=1 Tax=Larkinella insperata TaxID=332158 RepID=A0ABW3Q1Y8_9BACT|nr:asparagine synthase (glutamine-hydrolyzing) [Larkinella insperata]
MCGILGSVNIALSEKQLDLIGHRGPDGYGLKELNVRENRVYLGHRRLSIVDLSPAGAQPMHSPCGRYHLLFNGEIYNHQVLRRELSTVAFRGHSDTETILYYLMQHGIEGVKAFNGIFAIAFLDTHSGKLWLVRDRFGVKPLYYHQRGHQLVFSSEIRPIADTVSLSLNPEALAVLLRLRYNPSPDTLYNEVNKLRPGHIAEYNLRTGSFTVSPFHQRQPRTTLRIPFAEAVEEYGRLVENAIKNQLMSDVEVGVLLSGGIDSAIVAHFAAKHSPHHLKAFTVGYAGKSRQNEIEPAQATARALGLEHHTTVLSEEEFQKNLARTVGIIEEPSATTSILPMYHLCRLASRHVKVVLTGQGADEPLGGYFRYQNELLYEKLPAPTLLSKWLSKVPALTNREETRRALMSWRESDTVKRFDESYAVFTNREIQQLTGISESRAQEYIRYYYELMQGETSVPVEAMMQNDLYMNLSDDLLNYTDKLSMHFGLEARVPFLDNELVDFISCLPREYKLSLGRTKIIHKAFAQSILPDSIVNRRKNGFESPAQQWLKGASGDTFRRLLVKPTTAFSQAINTRAVDQLFADHQQGGHNREKQLFALLSVYCWMEKQPQTTALAA